MPEPEKKLTEDVVLGDWVYCHQHLNAHRSGWCTVSINEKVGLGSFPGAQHEQIVAAAEKCRRLGLLLYDPSKYK